MRARMPGLNRVNLNRPSGRFGAPSQAQVREMRRIIGNRHTAAAASAGRRQAAASRAYANRPTQRLGRAVNRGLWNLRRSMTPQTLTGKAKLGVGLGAAGLGLTGALGGVLGGLLANKTKTKKQKGGIFLDRWYQRGKGRQGIKRRKKRTQKGGFQFFARPLNISGGDIKKAWNRVRTIAFG